MLGQMVAKGSESLSDSIISRLLECRQQQGGAKELAESSSPVFTWQILTGRGEASLSNQTLSEAVEIFTVHLPLVYLVLAFEISCCIPCVLAQRCLESLCYLFPLQFPLLIRRIVILSSSGDHRLI